MSLLVTIDSNGGDVEGTNEDFIQNFKGGILLDGQWEVGLTEAYIWHSWFNISSEYSNNELRYHNGGSWVEVTIPNGIYNIVDIDAYLKTVMKANGDYDGSGAEDVYYIEIFGNENTLKVDVEISNSYQLDLSIGTLHELLGFDSQILNATASGEHIADISRGISNMVIHCDIVNGSYFNGQRSDTILTFLPNVPPGALMHIAPNNPLYLPISRDVIDKIRMYITDQDGRSVTFNDVVSYSLHFRKFKE